MTEVDNYIKEFLVGISNANSALGPDVVKEGVNVNLQTDLALEQQVELNEPSRNSLSVKESGNLIS